MANMGKLEPSVLVIPIPFGIELSPEALPIEVEYLQEDVVVKAASDCHSSGRRVRDPKITGTEVSFGEKD